MIVFVVLFAFISVSNGQSSEQDPDPTNVITVPPNCPPGQEWINGMCRDVWSWRNNPNIADMGVIDPSLSDRNVITVSTNCPPGQIFINGQCRDVWRLLVPTTAIPKNFEYSNLETREKRQSDDEGDLDLARSDEYSRQIINIPNRCPAGYRPDALGICRQIL